jgi:hypothetical protein
MPIHFRLFLTIALIKTMLRDTQGFASLRATGPAPAIITTKPVVWSRGQQFLFVNVNTMFTGELTVTTSAANGSEASCVSRPLSLDRTRQLVEWAGDVPTGSASCFAVLAGKPTRLQFKLSGAGSRIYSWWVSNSSKGASGGYVAAGGPSFVGNRDL